jgi:hypothetical protein
MTAKILRRREIVENPEGVPYAIPMLIECCCGNELEVPHFTNECECCGALYNSWAQQLRAQQEWEDDDSYDPEV